MQFPKTAFIAALLAVVIVAAAGPAVGYEFKVNADRCWDLNAHPDLRIGACTWLLNSGRLAQKDIPIAFNHRGAAHDYKGQTDQAIRDYTEAIRLKPDDAKAFNNRGIVHGRKGQYDRAIADYDQAIRLKPDDAKAFNNRGNAYNRKGQTDRAIADYDQAIRLKPDYAKAFGNRGLTYENLGRRDQALRDYKKQYELGSRPKWLLDKLKKYGALP